MVENKPWPQAGLTNKQATSPSVLIVGAGISGMCVAIDLIKRQNCRNFIIVEKSAGVGGTWADNKYPGCCCDVWSLLYSYSFEQNPNWTREYPGQEEILQYLIGVAQKYNLFPHIRFNTSVDSAAWDDASQKWKTAVTVSGAKAAEYTTGYTIESDFLISAVGQLNVPKYPDIAGLDDFGGRVMHSARWDWTYDWAGKRVAIIGNGATAAQILPEIAQTAAHVAIHQRTPNWVFPRLDAPVTPLRQGLYRYLPPLRWRARAALMDIRESFYPAVVNGASDAAAMIRQLTDGALQAAFPQDAAMRDALTPKYNPGCKRVVISDDYYPALARESVLLETRPVARITKTGIEYKAGGVFGEAEGSREYDFLVLATGFRTLEFMHPIRVTGRHGVRLEDVWKGGASAFRGVTVPEIPNFGMMYGPNTNLGHNSIILMIEAQSRYMAELMGAVLEAKKQGKTLSLSPRADVTKKYNEEVQAILEKSSFADPKCQSWYKNSEGRITNNWSGTVVQYQKDLSKVTWTDYDVEGTGKDILNEKGGESQIGRVIEETQLSDTALWVSAASVAAVAAGWLLRSRVGTLLAAR